MHIPALLLTASLFTLTTSTPITKITPDTLQELGCYAYANWARAFSASGTYYVADNGRSNNSIEACEAFCGDPSANGSGQSYEAGFLWMGQMFCGCAAVDIPSDRVDAGFCNLTCPGNPSESCGGTSPQGDYFTGYAFSTPQPPAWHDLGCHADSIPGMLQNKISIDLFETSHEKCQADCKGYKYAAIERGVLCMCGNTLHIKKTAPAKECSVPCGGNHTETCEGILFRANLSEYY